MKNELLKIFSALLLTGAIVLCVVLYIRKSEAPDLQSSLLKSFAEQDTDHDGLSDNMESIYGTDSNNPDSDGDGYLDGEEIISGYDPLKPAPNDKLGTHYVITPRPAAGSMQDLNLTNDLIDKLTNKVVNEEIRPKQDGSVVSIQDITSVEDALEAAIQRSYQEFSLPNIPTDQLNITLDNSHEVLAEYAGKMAKALTNVETDPVENLKNEADVSFEKIKACEEAAAIMKTIKVPSDATALHKKQIGKLVVRANVLRAVANIREDPLKANIAFSAVEDLNQWEIEIMEGVKNLLETH